MLSSVEPSKQSDAEAGYRWLRAKLPPAEMLLLDRQGFVAYDRLPSGAMCAKLRFRTRDGRQRVVYLGVALALAKQVAAHLAVRQAATRRRQESQRLQRRVKKLLRSIRPRFAGCINSDGWHFHGRQLRKRRGAAEGSALHPTQRQKGVPMQDDQLAGPHEEPHPSFELFGVTSRSRYDAIRRWADGQESPFDAVIGYVTADMCDISGELAEQLKAVLYETRGALDEANGFAKNMQHYLQLQRHMERFVKMAPLRELRSPRAKNIAVDTYAAKPQMEREVTRAQLDSDFDFHDQPDS